MKPNAPQPTARPNPPANNGAGAQAVKPRWQPAAGEQEAITAVLKELAPRTEEVRNGLPELKQRSDELKSATGICGLLAYAPPGLDKSVKPRTYWYLRSQVDFRVPP